MQSPECVRSAHHKRTTGRCAKKTPQEGFNERLPYQLHVRVEAGKDEPDESRVHHLVEGLCAHVLIENGRFSKIRRRRYRQGWDEAKQYPRGKDGP